MCVRSDEHHVQPSATAEPPPPALDARLLHTIGQAATLLSVSDRTVKRLVEAGELRVIHIRTATRIPQWEIERYTRNLWSAENGVLQDDALQPTPVARRRRPPRRIAVMPRRS